MTAQFEKPDLVWDKFRVFMTNWLREFQGTEIAIDPGQDNFVPSSALQHLDMTTRSADCGGNLMTLDNPRTNPTPYRHFIRVGGGWRGFTTKSQAKAFYRES